MPCGRDARVWLLIPDSSSPLLCRSACAPLLSSPPERSGSRDCLFLSGIHRENQILNAGPFRMTLPQTVKILTPDVRPDKDRPEETNR